MKSIVFRSSLIQFVLALVLGIAGLFIPRVPLDLAGRLNVALAQGAPDATLLSEGEKHQVIQFNPAAALQKRIFADRFVPNSAEFDAQISGTSYTAQRAEDLGTGRVRVYFVVVGDWSNVQFVERGSATGDERGQALLSEGEKHQVIQFNPAAALQKRIFADGFVPNSAEFKVEDGGASYSAQRAENLGNGQVRVYYAAGGDWGNVRAAAGGGAEAAPVPAASGTGVRPGEWIATGEFGQLTLTVVPDGTAVSKVAFNFNKYTCGPRTISGGMSVQNPRLWPITNGEFTIDLPGPYDHFVITGRFSASGTAAGTWRAESGSAVCSGNWTVR